MRDDANGCPFEQTHQSHGEKVEMSRDMGRYYEKLRSARFLYALYKRMRNQIDAKTLDVDEIYLIRIEGHWIGALREHFRKLFRDTDYLQKRGF